MVPRTFHAFACLSTLMLCATALLIGPARATPYALPANPSTLADAPVVRFVSGTTQGYWEGGARYADLQFTVDPGLTQTSYIDMRHMISNAHLGRVEFAAGTTSKTYRFTIPSNAQAGEHFPILLYEVADAPSLRVSDSHETVVLVPSVSQIPTVTFSATEFRGIGRIDEPATATVTIQLDRASLVPIPLRFTSDGQIRPITFTVGAQRLDLAVTIPPQRTELTISILPPDPPAVLQAQIGLPSVAYARRSTLTRQLYLPCIVR